MIEKSIKLKTKKVIQDISQKRKFQIEIVTIKQ